MRSFLDDKRPARVKRDELVDKLVGSPDFVEHWTNKWADLLQVNRKFLGPVGAKMLREWIQKEVKDNTPYDAFARKILTASGSNKENPPLLTTRFSASLRRRWRIRLISFWRPGSTATNVTTTPFERWTQDQYYEMAAYFAQFKLEKDPASGKSEIGKTAVERGKPLYEFVKDAKSGEMKHERTGEVTAPAFPYPAKHEISKDASTAGKTGCLDDFPDNQYFAAEYANRLWGYMFGIGIIEPIDDIRVRIPQPILNYWTIWRTNSSRANSTCDTCSS